MVDESRLIRATERPLIVYTDSGGVQVSFDGGRNWVCHETVAAYSHTLAVQNNVRDTHDWAAVIAFGAEKDAYHQRMQELHAERDGLRVVR
jgi:hypothetical protein